MKLKTARLYRFSERLAGHVNVNPMAYVKKTPLLIQK